MLMNIKVVNTKTRKVIQNQKRVNEAGLTAILSFNQGDPRLKIVITFPKES